MGETEEMQEMEEILNLGDLNCSYSFFFLILNSCFRVDFNDLDLLMIMKQINPSSIISHLIPK